MIRIPWRKVLQPGGLRRPAQPHAEESAGESQRGEPSNCQPAESDGSWAAGVYGERARFIVDGARSLQSKIPGLLAAGLMISVGAGMLAWYYAEALSRPALARTAMRASLPQPAGEGMILPPFGTVESPRVQRSAASGFGVPSMTTGPARSSSAGGRALPAGGPPPISLLEPPLERPPGGLPSHYRVPAGPFPRERVPDRRLSGEVLEVGGSAMSSETGVGGQMPVAAFPRSGVVAPTPVSSHGDDLVTLLRPGVIGATRAQMLPTQRLLLPKGGFIDCTLETAIDSTLPGMTTCVTATDTFGADGTVILLERGTKLIGETRGEVRQGAARVFVVWTEARTPSGVVVQLDSPGTDALGRAGLEGKVSRHFWQRFGAAALVSMIDGVVQSEVQSSSRGGTVVLDPTASEDVLTEILRGTVNIPPTVRIRNGARIQVLVARDIDFRSVYELRPR